MTKTFEIWILVFELINKIYVFRILKWKSKLFLSILKIDIFYKNISSINKRNEY